ncbi:MAG: hypothetical protein KC413_24920 [Anaerolineales bacterium]|nr:hypothetical protein [Anaerolineales bacterium]
MPHSSQLVLPFAWHFNNQLTGTAVSSKMALILKVKMMEPYSPINTNTNNSAAAAASQTRGLECLFA